MKNKGRPVQNGFWLLAIAALVISFGGCRGLVSTGTSDPPPPPPPPPPTGINQINHIILMAQENRGFDHYFGAMRQYWAANGIQDQSFDGLPQFNPTSGAAPLQGPIPTNPGCDPNLLPPAFDCTVDLNSPAEPSFHMLSMCEENPSPSWNESHRDRNRVSVYSPNSTMDGFVWTAAHDARAVQPPFSDINGRRAMSHYDGTDLPYYYFMATNFATSDRWFSPVMSRTQPNRMYMLAATSAGHSKPLATGSPQLTAPTIFDSLQAAGISWKIYVTDLSHTGAGNHPTQDSAINYFTAAAKYPQNIVPEAQFLTDVANGTLPAVSYIEPGLQSGLDEHPGLDDNFPGGSVQLGSQYVSTLINALMQSSSWKDSAFIFTFDEGGGFYDHVPPQQGPPFVNPDGILPIDLAPTDDCAPPNSNQPTCTFDNSGYRVPLIVISPFAKKNYVSHTPADYTAWLKFVETRFNLKNLTNRDLNQMDMTEFFDFTNEPWKTPPTPAAQPTHGPCYLNALP